MPRKTLILKLVLSSEYPKMPWKNGLGTSSQIEICPSTADFSQTDFLWRLSSAKISGPNTFSPFPNHDRILSVLCGGALKLNLEKTEALIKPYSSFQFKGSDKVECELMGEEITDLGIIYNSKWVEASIRYEDVNDQSQKLKLTRGISFVICATSKIQVNETGLDFLDCLKTDEAQEIKVKSLDPDARVAIVNIRSRTQA